MGKDIREIRSFEDLKVWQQGRKIQRMVRKVTISFPKFEKYRLTDQMIRSSRSISRNIAEGYGRYHYQENIRFCRISRGSLTELLNDALTAFEENYIDQKQLDELREEIGINNRLINGYINYLKKAKHGGQAKEPEDIYKPDTNYQ